MRFLLCLVFTAASAAACSCLVTPLGSRACETAWTFEAVFTGTVLDIAEPDRVVRYTGPGTPWPQRRVRIRVGEAFIGLSPGQKEIVVETGLGGGDCGYGFRAGFEYIIYAGKGSTGTMTTGICTPTRLMADAGEDLRYLRSLAGLPPGGELRVITVDRDGKWQQSGAAPVPPGLPATQLSITGPGVQKAAATDSKGWYQLANLPPGEYKVQASLEGYRAENARPVRVPAKGCVTALITMQMDRVVTGRIFSMDGQPVSGVTVEAIPAKPRHQNDYAYAADSSETDKEGRYTLRNLASGEYYLGVSLSRSPLLKAPYTRWFYPGTENPEKAVTVLLANKPETQTIDLTLPPAQKDRLIQGRVTWPDGRPAARVNVLLEDPRWPRDFLSTVASTTDEQGRFAVHCLDRTRYRIHARAFDGPAFVDPVTVEPGQEAADLRLVLSRTGHEPPPPEGESLESWRKGSGLK